MKAGLLAEGVGKPDVSVRPDHVIDVGDGKATSGSF